MKKSSVIRNIGIIFVLLSLAACSGGGGSSGGTSTAPSTKTMTVYAYGGLQPLTSGGAMTYTASLYSYGSTQPLVANVTQNANGTFSIKVTTQATTTPLYVVVTGTNGSSSPIVFEAFAGTLKAPVATAYVNEITTTALAEAVEAANTGSSSALSLAKGIISGGTSSVASAALTYFNKLIDVGTAPGTSGTAQINSAVTSAQPTVVNSIDLIAGALAECGNDPANCSSATLSTILNGGSAANTADALQYVFTNATSSSLISALLNAANSATAGNLFGATSATKISVYAPAVPSAPTIGTPTAADSQVVLSWSTVASATGYNVYVATSASGPFTLVNTTPLTGTTTDSVTNLADGTTYYFEVKALNAAGSSSASSVVSATPTATVVVPNAPTGLSASAGDGQVTLKWSASAGASDYSVLESTSSGGQFSSVGTSPVSGTSTTVTGLTDGTTYYFQVVANNSAGSSSASATVSAKPVAPVAVPSAPTNLSASAGDAQVVLTWKAVTGATGYNIYVSTTSGGSYTLANSSPITAGTTYTVTNLTDGTPYYFEVTAENSAGEGNASTVATATPQGANSPSQMGGAIQGHSLVLTGTISTIAGQAGVYGSADGTGTNARFYDPQGITTDGTNLYIADSLNDTIRKMVIATGAVTTIAGRVGVNTSVDGTGTNAAFSEPADITTDGTNLYIVDGQTIRKMVLATGAVTTIAGQPGVSGSADGTGTNATFSGINEITTDGTNLYIADGPNDTIRKMVLATGAVTTIAGQTGVIGWKDGTGTNALFSDPVGITTDGTNLYITSPVTNTIRKMVIATGVVTTIAGSPGLTGPADGIGTNALFTSPGDITTDGTSLYIVDGQTIRKMVLATGAVTTLVGQSGVTGVADGTGANATLSYPYGITTDGSSLFDTENSDTIRQIK